MVRAILRLTRLDTCLLASLAIFLPTVVRTRSVALGVGEASPLLFICICTFIANDLDDLEKDRINHPKRPLPAHEITTQIAAVLYFVFLGAALLSTQHFITGGAAFFYYGLMTLSISYGYVVEWLPSIKTIYVAFASSIPILIIAATFPGEPKLRIAAGSVFLLTLGREICGDILDSAGDAVSFLHKFRPMSLGLAAFFIQVVGLALLLTQINRLGYMTAFTGMSLLFVASAICWFKVGRRRLATYLMKLQLFVGLYFLT